MNVTVERLPESQVVLDITTDEQEFEKALQRAYRKVVNEVRLPGFRPGKAPRFVIEKMLGRHMLVEQAARDLLDPLYQRAIEQEGLNPVGEPSVDIYLPEPLAFKVTVQVYPTVDPGDYASLRAEPKPVAVTDEQLDETIERVRSSRSPWNEPAEARPARENDRVTIDVTIREVGSEENFREPLIDAVYVLGKDNLFPQLHDALIGMVAGGEQTIEITFGEDDETVEVGMRGKTMTYQLALKKIEEQELLPLDDDFASLATDGRLTSLEALRDDIRKDLLRAARLNARNEIGNELVKQVGEGATIELPTVMIDKQVDSDLENFRNHLRQDHGQSLEDHLRITGKTEEEIREELRPESINRLRNSMALREIATREAISVSAQDIEAEIDRLIGEAPNAAALRNLYGGNYFRNAIDAELFDRKLIDRLIEIATEGRGPFDPPEEPEAEAIMAEASEETEAAATVEVAASVEDAGAAETSTEEASGETAAAAAEQPQND